MPVTLSHPGVYIQEIPSGSRTITGVATSVAAFVGRALRGPVDAPVEISSNADFERIFGGLWRDSGLGYAVQVSRVAQSASALRHPGVAPFWGTLERFRS